MTANQINYARHQEDVRHNLETESQGRQVIAETGRHNLVTEDIGWYNAYEAGRHNRETESIGWFTAKETKRHNIAQEGIGWANVNLGYANLAEVTRHNKANEALGWSNVDIARKANTINEVNAITKAAEADTHRTAVNEQKRHNIQSEKNDLFKIQYSYDALKHQVTNDAWKNYINWTDVFIPNNFIGGINNATKQSAYQSLF